MDLTHDAGGWNVLTAWCLPMGKAFVRINLVLGALHWSIQGMVSQ